MFKTPALTAITQTINNLESGGSDYYSRLAIKTEIINDSATKLFVQDEAIEYIVRFSGASAELSFVCSECFSLNELMSRMGGGAFNYNFRENFTEIKIPLSGSVVAELYLIRNSKLEEASGGGFIERGVRGGIDSLDDIAFNAFFLRVR
jgi:hypothetical protein